MQPRPVASVRPREPPRSTGLPVTTAVAVCRACIEYVSMIHHTVRALVLASCARTSLPGPITPNIPTVWRRVILPSTAVERTEGSETPPPLDPPKGPLVTPHFQIIQAATPPITAGET